MEKAIPVQTTKSPRQDCIVKVMAQELTALKDQNLFEFAHQQRMLPFFLIFCTTQRQLKDHHIKQPPVKEKKGAG